MGDFLLGDFLRTAFGKCDKNQCVICMQSHNRQVQMHYVVCVNGSELIIYEESSKIIKHTGSS